MNWKGWEVFSPPKKMPVLLLLSLFFYHLSSSSFWKANEQRTGVIMASYNIKAQCHFITATCVRWCRSGYKRLPPLQSLSSDWWLLLHLMGEACVGYAQGTGNEGGVAGGCGVWLLSLSLSHFSKLDSEMTLPNGVTEERCTKLLILANMRDSAGGEGVFPVGWSCLWVS